MTRALAPADVSEFVYLTDVPGFVKIGYTSDPVGRLRHYQRHNPAVRAFRRIARGTMADEKALHKRLRKRLPKHRGEWFVCESWSLAAEVFDRHFGIRRPRTPERVKVEDACAEFSERFEEARRAHREHSQSSVEAGL